MKKLLLIISLLASFSVFAGPYDKPGFVTFEKDGRLWVFKADSKGAKLFQERGEPAVQMTMIARGPGGMTLKSDDQTTLDEYIKVMDNR